MTDCLANVTTLLNGFPLATASRKRAARTWNMIQNACDGDYEAVNLLWVPAHNTWEQAQKVRGSNGAYMSQLDWQGNRAVDFLAKIATQRGRTPWQYRRRLREYREYSIARRARLGAVTWASQSVPSLAL